MVLEQSRLNNEIGATISLQPNASRILQQAWNIQPEAARGMVDEGFRGYNVDGALVNEILLATKALFGAERMMYHRQDLLECLKEAATSTKRDGPPAIVNTSSRVISCDCSAGTIKLENGEEIHADLIIGADGIHSKLRSYVLDETVSPVRTGSPHIV